jgi:hypothetical protein
MPAEPVLQPVTTGTKELQGFGDARPARPRRPHERPVRVVHFRGDILAGPARGRNHRPSGAVWLARLAARQHVREHHLLVIGIGRFELRITCTTSPGSRSGTSSRMMVKNR